ncbi:MAG: cyclic nucleotide-binding domain-containing protein [Gallionellaceae bacterium]|nr:cyclic nucleotide-binding domain-containing protein [Gallionellaceae bacterium]
MRFVAARDTLLLNQCDPADHLNVLISGQLRLFIPLANGTERIITLQSPGEGYGEASLLTGSP